MVVGIQTDNHSTMVVYRNGKTEFQGGSLSKHIDPEWSEGEKVFAHLSLDG